MSFSRTRHYSNGNDPQMGEEQGNSRYGSRRRRSITSARKFRREPSSLETSWSSDDGQMPPPSAPQADLFSKLGASVHENEGINPAPESIGTGSQGTSMQSEPLFAGASRFRMPVVPPPTNEREISQAFGATSISGSDNGRRQFGSSTSQAGAEFPRYSTYSNATITPAHDSSTAHQPSPASSSRQTSPSRSPEELWGEFQHDNFPDDDQLLSQSEVMEEYHQRMRGGNH